MADKNIMSSKIVGIVVLALIIVLIATLPFGAFLHSHRPFVKILAYHSVSDGQGIADPAINKRLFARQIDFLSAHGYEPVFLSTALQRYKEGAATPPQLDRFNLRC